MSIGGNWDKRRPLSRREFIGLSGVSAAAVLLGTGGLRTEQALAAARFADYPFKLGVASGDPLPGGVVLWTRLAPDPLAEDGRGGVLDRPYTVRFEVSETEGFSRVVQRGAVQARPELAHSVHPEISGLHPDREYWYRFKVGQEVSPVGRTKTAPPADSAPAALTFAFASCQNYTAGYYTAYRHMTAEDLDVVVHLGDYIYEGSGAGTLGRAHLPQVDTRSLSDYRIRHAQYKTDPDLQAAHAAFPWILTWDDHEVDNNYADEEFDPDEPSPEVALARRAAAYRAYYENLPLRWQQFPSGPDLQLYRRLAFGTLAEFNVLDTRQYRSDQPAVGGDRPGHTEAQQNSITGEEQERWLLSGLGASRARWNVLAQQVFMAERDLTAGEAESFSVDAWDGYVGSRDRLLGFVAERGVSNPVVLTGDVHNNRVADLKADFGEPDSPTVATEFVGTSISTGGDGSDTSPAGEVALAENPHIKFFQNQRGYVRCHVTPDAWRSDFRVVPSVTQPGAPISTRATYVVEDGRPGAQPVT